MDFPAHASYCRALMVTDRCEVSWADIGKALGISRQAAWERFS
jgi:biotin operon repressor